MSVAWWAVIVVLAWYPVGLLLIGLGSRLFGDELTPYLWRELRTDIYFIAILGPVISVFIVAVLVSILAERFYKWLTRKISVRGVIAPLVATTDWIIAGFRKPPSY